MELVTANGQTVFCSRECNKCGGKHAFNEPHEYLYIDEDGINPYLIDPISSQPFLDAINLPCGHTFSRIALETALMYKNECPQCRRPLKDDEEMSSAFLLRGLTDQLFVKCPLKCGAGILERGKLEHHLSLCPNKMVKCMLHLSMAPTDSAADANANANADAADIDSSPVCCKAIIKRKDVPHHNCIEYWRTAAIKTHRFRQQDRVYYKALFICDGLIDPPLNHNNKEALKEFRNLAQQGHVLSLFALGQCYEFGKLDLQVDLVAALECYEAAKAGGVVAAKEKVNELRKLVNVPAALAQVALAQEAVAVAPVAVAQEVVVVE
jgi:hypothetical protein